MSSEQDLRQEMIGIVDELYANQMITPTGGNISVRLTDEVDAYLITPSMLYKGALKPEHIVKVNCKGRACERRQRPSVETPVHLSVYVAFPEVEAVIHCHAKRCIALGLVNGSIPPISVDAVPFTDTQVIPYNLPGTPELCADVVKALQRSPAVLLQGHGLVTVGWTLRQAANRALAIEEVVEILLACRQFGQEPQALPPETVEMMKAAGVA